MKKINILWASLNLIFLIAFNALFFMLGGKDHSATVWISYGLIHFSYLMLLATPYFVRGGGASSFYGRPLYSISYTYFLVELITGIIFILITTANIKLILTIQIVVTAIYAYFLLSNLIANEYTADSVIRHEIELQYIKESSAKLNSILRQISDNKMIKKVEYAYDLIKSSPVKSSYEVQAIEQEVIDEIENLREAVGQNNPEQIIGIVKKICTLAEDRNRQLKLLN